MANYQAKGGPGLPKGYVFSTTNSPSSVRWKWELAIRFMLKNPNAKMPEVAQHVGVAEQTLAQWKVDPEWTNLHNQITTGILSSIDADLAEDITHQRLTLKRLVPTAIQNLADLALQSANPSIKLKASQEILDRDGNFAKVARVGLAMQGQGGVSDQKDDDVSRALLESLAQARGRGAEGQPAAQATQAPPTIESPSPWKQV